MRYVSINNARPGMFLAYDLFDSHGRVLIGEGCALSESALRHIEEAGFKGLYINDELSEDIQITPVVSPELRAAGMACIQELDIDRAIQIAGQMVDEIMQKGPVQVNMQDLRSFDDETYAHSVHVAALSCVLGMSMGLEADRLEGLVIAALLHDIGKLQINSAIFYKREHLSPEEYQVMKSHAVLSYEMIADRTDLPVWVKQAVLHHHENVDGTGYPEGLSGSEQSVYTKILHVADVYDALTSRRPYKRPYAPAEAIEYIMGGCGSAFDAEVVRHFVRCIALYPIGTTVHLSNGQSGIVIENSGDRNFRPRVRLETGNAIDLLDRKNLNLTITSTEEEYVEAPSHREKSRRNMTGRKTPRLLIVDDTLSNRENLRKILEDKYDLIFRKSGEEAIQYLELYEEPDLVILDMDMPDMDGVETVSLLHRSMDQVPSILFVADRCDAKMVKTCGEMKAAGYMIRPYRKAYIRTEVERILNDWIPYAG